LGRVEEIIEQGEERHKKGAQQEDDIHPMTEEGNQVFVKTRNLVRIRFGGVPTFEKGFAENGGFLLRLKWCGHFTGEQEEIDSFRFAINFHLGAERRVRQKAAELLRIAVNQLPLQ
jgi:hypothetical protein